MEFAARTVHLARRVLVARCVLLLAMLALLAMLPARTASARDRVPWVNDLRVAQQQAAAKNQLILLHFWDTNCPPCRRIEKNVFSQATFAHQLCEKYVPVKLAVSQNPDLARHYQIEAWPTDVIVTPTGEEVFRTISPQEQTAYLNMLNQVAWRHHTRPDGMSPDQAATAALPPIRNSTTSKNPSSDMELSPAMLASHEQFEASSSQASTFPSDAYAFSNTDTDTASAYASDYPPSTESALDPQMADASEETKPEPKPQVVSNPYVSQPTVESPPSQSAGLVLNDTIMPQPHASELPQVAATDVRPGFRTAPATADLTTILQPSPHAGGLFPSHSEPPAAPPTQPTTPTLKPCLDGHCPVALVEQGRWVPGDRRWGAHHRGRTYLFQSAEAQQKFLAAPDRYSPGLAGFDPVIFAEQGVYREGNRAHGVMYNNQIFLFADEESLGRFWTAPARYANLIHQAMGTSDTQFR